MVIGVQNVQSLNRVLLPVIRRVMPSAIANQILSVQPMTGSAGQIMALNTQWRMDFIPDYKIYQVTNFEYQFGFDEHPEIVDWLTSDCVWNFIGYTNTEEFDHERVVVIFDDIRGSVEFKVRFCE